MKDHSVEPERHVSEEPFPPYAYVPGKHPHPISDPRGHLYGRARESLEPFDAENWCVCRPYLVGIDLFNHGYFWEAHEVWEGLWLACGRTGIVATFLKGLIKLAAAGCKRAQGVPEGVRSHGMRARELFCIVQDRSIPATAELLGLRLTEVIACADSFLKDPERRVVLQIRK